MACLQHTHGLIDKFAKTRVYMMPPHHKYVATLRCETWMSVNWRQSKICIVINDKSQASIG